MGKTVINDLTKSNECFKSIPGLPAFINQESEQSPPLINAALYLSRLWDLQYLTPIQYRGEWNYLHSPHCGQFCIFFCFCTVFAHFIKSHKTCKVIKCTSSHTINIWTVKSDKEMCYTLKKKKDLRLLVLLLGDVSINFSSSGPRSTVLWKSWANLPASSALIYLQEKITH